MEKSQRRDSQHDCWRIIDATSASTDYYVASIVLFKSFILIPMFASIKVGIGVFRLENQQFFL